MRAGQAGPAVRAAAAASSAAARWTSLSPSVESGGRELARSRIITASASTLARLAGNRTHAARAQRSPALRRTRLRRLDHQRRRRAPVGGGATAVGAVGGAGHRAALHQLRHRRGARRRCRAPADPGLRGALRRSRRPLSARLPLHRGQRCAGGRLGSRPGSRPACCDTLRFVHGRCDRMLDAHRAAAIWGDHGRGQGRRAECRNQIRGGRHRRPARRARRFRRSQPGHGRSRAPHCVRPDRHRRAGTVACSQTTACRCA